MHSLSPETPHQTRTGRRLGRLPIYIMVLLGVLSACKSRYQKLLDSRDLDLKYQKAMAYYDNKKYLKAQPLFQELISLYRGDPRGETSLYRYAWTYYHLKDPFSAQFYFKEFTSIYPLSEFIEEAIYMNAYCYYLQSPVFSLDQEPTRKALEAFQVYLVRFPDGDRVPQVHKYRTELRAKLEKKAYENARLFYQIGDYRAAVVAAGTTIQDWPESKYRTDLEWMRIQAQVTYARNSVAAKQEERWILALEWAREFEDQYPDDVRIAEVRKIQSTIREYLDGLRSEEIPDEEETL